MAHRRPRSRSVGHDTVRAATRVLLVATSLIFLVYLISLLPGVGQLVPETPITVAALATAFVTLAVAALLCVIAPKLADLTKQALDAPDEIADSLSSLVFWTALLAAALVAHQGLAGVVTPLLGDLSVLYDLLFLVVALPMVAFMAVWLYALIDPVAELVADHVTESRRR